MSALSRPDCQQCQADSQGTPNRDCPRCEGWGELCTGPCGFRTGTAAADALLVAQYAKTYANGGPVWEAACRILARHATEVTP